MSRRRRAASAPTIPGTAVAPPRRTLDDVIAATSRPTAVVPGQQPLVDDDPVIGSLCTGYGGLDEAVQEVLGGRLAWVSDVDPGACKILAHRHPNVPNIGDLTVADWQHIVDTYGRPYAVIGGYPCQPFSLAGELKGTEDERHLWPHIARALGVLRPRYAIFENVANHLRLGFDTVLCDLADLGFDVEWVVVRADSVGAPHQRRRLIFVATASDAPRTGWEGAEPQRGRAAGDSGAAADAADLGHERAGGTRGGRSGPTDSDLPAADPAGSRRAEGCSLTDTGDGASREGGKGESPRDGAEYLPDRRNGWGEFAPAIARWETTLGRPAPRPTDDRGRLSPPFVEWMMGLRSGHVTGVPSLSRAQQLKALGNGVVPQQAAAALRMLLDRSPHTGQRAA